jgi:arabinofuranosyltransferase
MAKPRLVQLAVLALLAAVIGGALALSFLCDDAYITFRYVSNARDGLGLVWNPPPFQPVEGYTSFLWALVLWAAWSLTGLEPPATANALSIACGALEFLVLAVAALRLRDRTGERLPAWIALLALVAIAGNRTFLQWMTSGLETSLWNLVFVTWVVLAFRSPERRTARWLALWSSTAALAALTRPDGLLLGAATAGVAAVAHRRQALGLLPLLAVAAHVVWRRAFYGEWLPNTYYAKVVGAWPEAGLRYFACFALEHAVWLWIPLALTWCITQARRAGRDLPRLLLAHAPATAAVAASIFYCGYYVLQVGGDHFEYRVFSQLVPLGILSAAAMAAQLGRGARLPAIAVLALWLGSGGGWVHLWLTRDLPPNGFRTTAPQVPGVLRPLARWYDRQQAWLLFRNIGLRCNHHRALLERFRRPFPERVRIVSPPDPFPAFAIGAVGISGWSLPGCVLLDLHGLNDWVIARTPVPTGPEISSERLRPLLDAVNTDEDEWIDAQELDAAITMLAGRPTDAETNSHLVSILLAMFGCERDDALTLAEADTMGDVMAGVRSMAHERHPPPGYIEAFEPNVTVPNGIPIARPREVPLTAERVREIEAEWRQRVREGRLR